MREEEDISIASILFLTKIMRSRNHILGTGIDWRGNLVDLDDVFRELGTE